MAFCGIRPLGPLDQSLQLLNHVFEMAVRKKDVFLLVLEVAKIGVEIVDMSGDIDGWCT